MMTEDFIQLQTTRRGFLKTLGIAGMTAGFLLHPAARALASSMPQAPVPSGGECRDVCLYNANTQETIETVFFKDGKYDEQSFNQLCHFLRDSHEDVSHWMDPRLLTMLNDMQNIFERRQIQVISGFRTARTNALLARTVPGVGKDSYHMRGQAIDIRIPGIETSEIRDVAKTLAVGGVGYYPEAHFVHVDTGPIRYW